MNKVLDAVRKRDSLSLRGRSPWQSLRLLRSSQSEGFSRDRATSLRALLLVILAAGLLLSGCSGGSSGTRTLGQAPDFQLQNLSGQSVSLRDFQGKPILINFWATWCPTCVYEMPFLQEIYEDWTDKGLVVLAIDVGESQSTVVEFLQAHNLSLPVLLDSKEEVTQKYMVSAYPTTFFIDKQGAIREKVVGAFPNKAAIEKKLAAIIP